MEHDAAVDGAPSLTMTGGRVRRTDRFVYSRTGPKATRNNDRGDWRTDCPLIVIAGKGPPSTTVRQAWMPAFAGMTGKQACVPSGDSFIAARRLIWATHGGAAEAPAFAH